MDAERSERIRQILQLLVDVPLESRDAVLAEACHGNGEVRRQVQEILDGAGQISQEEFDAAFYGRRTIPVRRVTPPRHEPPLCKGNVVGKYHIVGVINRGGDGLLHKATDGSLHNRVVVLKEVGIDSPVDVRRRQFEAEKQALARVQHPAVVRIYDFVEQDERCFIVTEFLDGVRLPTRLPSRVRKADVSRALAGALKAVHDAGLVHNDIKPENVILMKDGRAVLIDLGIAEVIEGGTEPRPLHGTVPYLAPERCLGEPPRRASDVYSLGLVFYSIWAGSRPYPRLSHVETLVRKLTRVLPREPLDRQATPPELVDLILRMTATEPDERPTIEQVVTQLADVQGTQTATVHRHQRITLAASVALALAVPAVAWYWPTADGNRPVHATEAEARAERAVPVNLVAVPSAPPDSRPDADAPSAIEASLPATNAVDDVDAAALVAISDPRANGTDLASSIDRVDVPPDLPTPDPIAGTPLPDRATAIAGATEEVASAPAAPSAEALAPNCEAVSAGVRNVLDELETGYRERSVAKIAGVFPALNTADLENIGISFAALKEYDYSWDKEGAVIEVTCGDSLPNSARIRAERTVRLVPRVGRSTISRSYLTVYVERRGARWAIVSIAQS